MRSAADSAVTPSRRDRNGGLLLFASLRPCSIRHAVKRPTGRAERTPFVFKVTTGKVRIGTEAIHGTDSSHPRALGIPIGQHCGLAKRAPRRSRWRPSHSVKSPYCLRGLAPQSLFVATCALKQGRVKMGKAQETLGDGAGLRPWSERRARGRRRQRFLAAGRRLVSPVRAGTFDRERPRLTGTARGVLTAREQKFALDLK